MSIKRLHATSVAIEDNGVAIFGEKLMDGLKIMSQYQRKLDSRKPSSKEEEVADLIQWLYRVSKN